MRKQTKKAHKRAARLALLFIIINTTTKVIKNRKKDPEKFNLKKFLE